MPCKVALLAATAHLEERSVLVLRKANLCHRQIFYQVAVSLESTVLQVLQTAQSVQQ